MNENVAFNELVDRYKGSKAIFITDRGYESYNNFEHVVHSGNKYLIRVRDITSKKSIMKSFCPYPDTDEFDIHSKKRKLIKQEIYARLLLYNFCQRIVQDIKIVKKKTKYTYQVNFTKASHIIRKFLNKKRVENHPLRT